MRTEFIQAIGDLSRRLDERFDRLTAELEEIKKVAASRSTKSRSGNVVVGRSGDVVVVRADHEREDIAKLEAEGKIGADTTIVSLVRFNLP
jgi:hypothetical protein